ncbi:MAG: B12-binding domain-containing radical SAM protein [Nitrospirae bacterium]|nr:B12-binding domain-containing radical SAM protein [Nitrospirota bacterium]
MKRKEILLVYPKMGMSGSLVQHIPLSVLYAASESIRRGFDVDVIDVRLNPQNWETDISSKVTPDTLIIGLSVMTGSPIRNALDISRWVKAAYPDIKVVWGGPHTMFNAEEILVSEKSVDYAISGYGSKPLSELAAYLRGDTEAPSLTEIKGLIFRDDAGKAVSVPRQNAFEHIYYKDIPYHLIEHNLKHYTQLGSAQRIFPIYSALGCPYKCSFCSSPVQYKHMEKSYVTLPHTEVVDHIEYVQNKYGAQYIYFIDDDSFVNIAHVDNIIEEINKRGLKIKLGFRGARINEIKKMSDEFLSKLAKAGTDIMHIGAESGSQRILDMVRKNCTVADIIEINQKMARHPEIKTAYNWIVGLPGETLDDLRQSRELMKKLVNDNPGAIIFIPDKFRPLPGSELYEAALKYGYTKPTRVEDWIDKEVESDDRPPWFTKDIANTINMMQITSFFIDNKLFKVETGDSMKFKMLRLMARIYSPVAKARFNSGFSNFLIEYKLFNLYAARFRK